MARHRKLPVSNKRKKLKSVDPFNRASNCRQVRLQQEQRRRNLDPLNVEQGVPKWSKELKATLSTDRSLSRKRRRKKDKGTSDVEMMEGFERRKWETDRQFLNRVQRETDAFVREQKMKIKYRIDNSSVPLGLEEQIEATKAKVKRPGDTGVLSETIDSGNRSRRASWSSDSEDCAASQHKEGLQKPYRKRSRRRRKKNLRVRDSSPDMKDDIAFGERVDAPPSLSTMPRKAHQSLNKAGKKDLLLNRLLQNPSGDILDMKSRSYKSDGTIKCEDPIREKDLAQERSRVIELYRGLKSKRNAIA